jgi:hypothetical protein
MIRHLSAVLITVSTMWLAACSEQGTEPGLQGSINRVGKPITITVNTVNTQSELRDLYAELTGVPDAQVPDQWGFAQWNETVSGADPEQLRCDVYVLQPRKPDDQRVLTLGHELAHCVWGSYHN